MSKKAICFALLILLLSAFGSLAQTGEGEIENWVEATVLCQTADNWLLEVDVSATVSSVYIFPDVEGAWVWFVGEAKTRRFWIDKSNEHVSIRVEVGEQGGYQADTVLLGDADDCDAVVTDTGSPMNECLGIPLFEFIAMTNYEPLGDVFQVDGRDYAFHETLSFFVPVDAVWTWDLYVDGRHLARFEQAEDSACRVTEVYPQ